MTTRYYIVRVEDEGRVQCRDITPTITDCNVILDPMQRFDRLLNNTTDYSRNNSEQHENAADAIRATMPDAYDD